MNYKVPKSALKNAQGAVQLKRSKIIDLESCCLVFLSRPDFQTSGHFVVVSLKSNFFCQIIYVHRKEAKER